jgi:hypothetical protein
VGAREINCRSSAGGSHRSDAGDRVGTVISKGHGENYILEY